MDCVHYLHAQEDWKQGNLHELFTAIFRGVWGWPAPINGIFKGGSSPHPAQKKRGAGGIFKGEQVGDPPLQMSFSGAGHPFTRPWKCPTKVAERPRILPPLDNPLFAREGRFEAWFSSSWGCRKKVDDNPMSFLCFFLVVLRLKVTKRRISYFQAQWKMWYLDNNGTTKNNSLKL